MENNRDKTAENEILKDKLMAIILLESAKDYKKMDSDLVTECVDFLMELEGKERLTKEEIERRVNKIPFKGKVTALNSYAKKKLRAKRIAVIAAILAVLITLFGILAVGSGNIVSDFVRKVGNSISEILDGGPVEYGGVTIYESDKTITYSSLEEFKESEDIEILYPSWLPGDEKIVGIYHTVLGEVEEYDLYTDDLNCGVTIVVGANLDEEAELSCEKKEVAGHTVYYFDAPEFVQGDFVYENNLYRVKADNEDNLFRIIENLKETN